MTKKTWTTILIVLLVIAAAVAIYFLTRPAQTPPPVETAPPVESPAVTGWCCIPRCRSIPRI